MMKRTLTKWYLICRGTSCSWRQRHCLFGIESDQKYTLKTVTSEFRILRSRRRIPVSCTQRLFNEAKVIDAANLPRFLHSPFQTRYHPPPTPIPTMSNYPIITINHPTNSSSFSITTFGGHLLSYTSSFSPEPVLWLSQTHKKDMSKSIRGGGKHISPPQTLSYLTLASLAPNPTSPHLLPPVRPHL